MGRGGCDALCGRHVDATCMAGRGWVDIAMLGVFVEVMVTREAVGGIIGLDCIGPGIITSLPTIALNLTLTLTHDKLAPEP